MKRKCTISIFTENNVGLLNRVTIIFTRRKINIESITASESEVPGVHRYTIVIKESEQQTQKVVKQLEKQVEILAAFYHFDNELYAHELAIFKIRNSKEALDFILDVKGNVIDSTSEYVVFEKTGKSQELIKLADSLKHFELLEFVKSGRLAITKPMTSLQEYLEQKRASFETVLNTQKQ